MVIIMDAKQFGAFLAQCRKQRGMTQADLAHILHVTDKAVSRWERGLGFPDINTITPLAAALGVSVYEIMRSEKMENHCDADKDAVMLMKSAAEIAVKNRRQEETATVLAVFTTIITAVLFWLAGFGNFGGSVFFGTVISVAEISLYYYMDSGDDTSGKKIYAVSFLIAAAIIIFVIAHVLL